MVPHNPTKELYPWRRIELSHNWAATGAIEMNVTRVRSWMREYGILGVLLAAGYVLVRLLCGAAPRRSMIAVMLLGI